MAETEKVIRILTMYKQLLSGKRVNKDDFCSEYGINKRSFERDIEDIRTFLSESFSLQELIYDRKSNSYILTNVSSGRLCGEESLILVYMLFSLKNIRDDEREGILRSILSITEFSRKDIIYKIISNSQYFKVKNKQELSIMKMQWDLSICILNKRVVKLNYLKSNGESVYRKIKPVDIVYDDGYIYLIAYLYDEKYKYPAFFRIDRILEFDLISEYYSESLIADYQSLNMKEKLKYMQGGELLKVILKCNCKCKSIIESSFKNIKLIEKNDEEFIYEIQCFEQGFIQWLMGQSIDIEVISPQQVRNKILEKCRNILNIYEEE